MRVVSPSPSKSVSSFAERFSIFPSLVYAQEFFRSEWFEALTSVDGSVILRKLKQEENIHDE